MIVVTGGAGFIGSNLVAALEERGLGDIVVCDHMGQDDKWRNLAKRELGAIVAPERLIEFLDSHASEIETIFHMGAISATTERDVDLVVASNFTLSQRLWDWCTAHQARLIYASSAATYGDRRVARIVAGNGPRPKQWAGLKFFNVYGPNEDHKGAMKSVVAHIFPRAQKGEPARLFRSHRPDYPDGGQQRDFVYVRDCVALLPAIGIIGTVRAEQARRLALLGAWEDMRDDALHRALVVLVRPIDVEEFE